MSLVQLSAFGSNSDMYTKFFRNNDSKLPVDTELNSAFGRSRNRPTFMLTDAKSVGNFFNKKFK